MDRYTVFTPHGAIVEENVPLARAAKLLDVQESDLAWCVEQVGSCYNANAWAVAFGDEFPLPNQRLVL